VTTVIQPGEARKPSVKKSRASRRQRLMTSSP
jgi:hypothetical protein